MGLSEIKDAVVEGGIELSVEFDPTGHDRKITADLLLTFARGHAYVALWSERILGEVEDAIVNVTNGAVSTEAAKNRTGVMRAAFGDAMVLNWESLEDCIIGLPDANDRHVVAAAVRSDASAIVTDMSRTSRGRP